MTTISTNTTDMLELPPPEPHMKLPQQQQQPAPSHALVTMNAIVRPTEAQLRWAQFHHSRVAQQVQERVRRMYLLPQNIHHVPNTIPSDLVGLVEDECDYEDNNEDSEGRSNKPKISKGRQVLLRVSQREYEERRQKILNEGYDYDRNEEEKKGDNEDILDSIFAETKKIRRSHRKRRRSTLRLSTNVNEDTERIRRFESAFYALLSTLAALESKRNHTNEWTKKTSTTTKKWSRPTGMSVPTTIDGREYSDLKWGISAPITEKSSALQQQPQMFDRSASWMIHIPPKVTTTGTTTTTPQFTNDIRRHLQDVARQYLRDNNDDNEKVADDGDDDDDVVSFVECFERHLTDVNVNKSIDHQIVTPDGDGITKPISSNDIASFVAKYEQQRGHTKTTVQIVSPTTADLISRFENPNIRDGFVQRLVSEIESALTQQQEHHQSSSHLISADGKLHKPTFARLIQRYLLSVASSTSPTTGRDIIRNPFQKQFSTCDIPSEECNSVTQQDGDDHNDNNQLYDADQDGYDDGNSNHPQVSKFVATFMDQFELQQQQMYDTADGEDDDNHTILTSDGTLNRSVLEQLVHHCIDEASKISLDDGAHGDVGDTSSAIALETYLTPQRRLNTYEDKNANNDLTATPVRSIATTTSDVFDRLRTVSAKMKNFRFGKDESIPSVATIDDDEDNDNATSREHPKSSNNIVGTVSNKVSELFQSLHMKNTSDEAAYIAFREIQDQKRRGIDPPTNTYHDGDVSSQSSFRVLPRGIRNVVKSFRSTMTASHRSQIEQHDNEHKLEMEGCDDDENETSMFDDIESGTDFTHDFDGDHDDPIDQQQSALLFGLQAGISGSMDTDGSTISGNGQHSANRVGLMAGIMLSPTLLTKRHQQAIRAVESYNWAQVKYLLSANPWLAEMADVNTNQYVLHKVAYYGSGQLGLDHVTGEVISVRNVPAPESLNMDLVNLFPSSVHKLDHDGNLPLHMAALSANLPMIQLLGDKFCSGASVRNEDGMLPLHLVLIACASPLVATIGTDVEPADIVQAVLKYFPGAIGVTDNEGNLPIHTAASVLRGSQGATIISWLLDETEKLVSGPSLLRFRSKTTMQTIYDEALETSTDVSQSDSSVHGDESTNCLLAANELGHTPLLLAIYSHAGWEVIESLILKLADVFSLDSENNNALHLLVSEQYKDPGAALKVLSIRPATATVRNNNGMLPIEIACLQMLPDEVILALVLVDLPISLDTTDVQVPKDGFGANSWWYLVCECDDFYVNIVKEVASLCTFPQIRSLCLLENGSGDILLARATPKCRCALDSVLRIVGRFEFVESSPIFIDSLLGIAAYNALDFGSHLDPIPGGKSVILKCYTSEQSFLNDTAVLQGLQLKSSHLDEILTFKVDAMDADRGPLPIDGLTRYFISIENPKLTLAAVVRGMLSNHGCQTDKTVRQRYSGKVFLVLRSIANALHDLHSQGHVHGTLSLVSCAKFDEKWKLTHLLDAKRVGDIISFSIETLSVPPEALKWTTNQGTEGQVAYEALVGQPLVPGENDDRDDVDTLRVILRWSDANLLEVKRELERIGIIDPGIELIVQCLSPNEGTRPHIDQLLQHKFWTQY